MNLTAYIKSRLKHKDILLMTHIVLGYPDYETCGDVVSAMVMAGVDIIELQIPFTDPIADGPVIVKANHVALEKGATVERCLEFSGMLAKLHDIPFVIMTYYNIVFKLGVERFSHVLADGNIKGAIVPDIPPEEAGDYIISMKRNHLDTIFLFSPTTPASRMQFISKYSSGFIYCVARKGVTGEKTDFTREVEDYLLKCRTHCPLPIAVGFGVQGKEDMNFLTHKADIAVIGTKIISIIEDVQNSQKSIYDFISSLFES